MRKLLADIPLFVEVAKRKSFTKAAEALEIPLPTVSRRIAEMEKELGVKLFNRNNRKVEVTDVGDEFYGQCEHILAEAVDAKEKVVQSQETTSGRIRISLTPTFYFICMQGVLCSFAEKYPDIVMQVNLSFQAMEFDDCDVKIWSGPPPDSSLKVRKVIDSQMGLYAVPTFFGERHPPQKLHDLHGENFIQLKGFFEHSLELRNGSQKTKIMITPKHVVNNMALSLEFLMAGQGIAVLHKQIGDKLEQAGALMRLLPEWTCLGFETYVLSPAGPTPRRIKMFTDHLVECLQAAERFPQRLSKNLGGIMVECPSCPYCQKQ